MSRCVACSRALDMKRTPSLHKSIERQQQKWNQMLDALEYRGSERRPKVQMLRALFKRSKHLDGDFVNQVERRNRVFRSGQTRLSDRSMSRSEHCATCRATISKSVPKTAHEQDQLLTYEGLGAFVEWLENEAEQLRHDDPQHYDDVIASYAWCVQETMEVIAQNDQRSWMGTTK